MSTEQLNEAMRKGELELVKKFRSEGVEWNDKSLDEAVNGKLELPVFSPMDFLNLMNNRTACWIFAMGDNCPYLSSQAVPIVALNYLKIDWTLQFWIDFYYANTEALSKYPAAFGWIQVQLGLRTFSDLSESKPKQAEIVKAPVISSENQKLINLSVEKFKPITSLPSTEEVLSKFSNLSLKPNPSILSKFKSENPNFNFETHLKKTNRKLTLKPHLQQ